MSFRDSDRFEYIRQPHIIVLLVLALVIVIGAVYTGWRRLDSLNTQTTTSTEQKCLTFISDQDLCKFIDASETDGFSNYVSVTTETDESSYSITVLEVETPNRMKSVTTDGIRETNAYILLDADTYAKDYTDGGWGKFTDLDYVPDEGGLTYDMSTEASSDVVLFRDSYRRVATEPCGGLTCFKYQINDANNPTATSYIWFDNQHYLVQRYQSFDETDNLNIQYDYKPVSVSAPSPVKSVTEDEIMQLLE